jgi:hypothetical protein
MRNTIFILAFILIGCSPTGKYRSLPEVKAWENDIRKFEELDQTEKYSPEAVLFAGSSSIRLWSDIASDMAPYEVIQRGFGGSKLSDLVVYADRIISPHPCRAIVLFVANDITGNNGDKTPEETASLFRNVLKIIRKSHPVTPVFWIEITPTPLRWNVWPQVSQANQLIKEVCENNKNTYFISTGSAFLDEKGFPMPEYFMPDKLHLNPEGYKVWSGIIKTSLGEVIGEEEASVPRVTGGSKTCQRPQVLTAFF